MTQPCKYHPSEPAKFQCTECGSILCKCCVNIKVVADTRIATCPDCKGLCKLYDPQKTAELRQAKGSPKSASFKNQLLSALAYPLSRHGKFQLISYFGLFLVLYLLMQIPLIGTTRITIAIILARACLIAYILAFLFNVITSSANGDEDLPDWPNYTDILEPAFMLAFTTTACFALPIFCHFYYETPIPTYLTIIMIALGIVYLPMALLAVTLYDSLLAINPFTVIKAIMKILPSYLAVLAMIFIVLILISMTIPIPFLGFLITQYSLLVLLRLVGLIYHENHAKIDWFET